MTPTGWSPERMLARLAGDEELARHLVEIFINECPRMLETVRVAVEQNSAEALRRAAHAFKGSALNFVDEGSAATAFELEQMGREGQIADARSVFERLEREAAGLLDELRRYQTGDACKS